MSICRIEFTLGWQSYSTLLPFRHAARTFVRAIYCRLSRVVYFANISPKYTCYPFICTNGITLMLHILNIGTLCIRPLQKIPFKYHWMVLGGIMAKGIWMVSEWYLNDILESLYRSMVLNGILNYHWLYHWVLLKYHWMVQWYWMILNGIQWYSVVYHWLLFVRDLLLSSQILHLSASEQTYSGYTAFNIYPLFFISVKYAIYHYKNTTQEHTRTHKNTLFIVIKELVFHTALID